MIHVAHDTDDVAVLVDHLEADQVRDVERIVRERGEVLAAHTQLCPPLDRAVELDRTAATADLPGHRDTCRLALDEHLGAYLESLRVLARLLDHERAVNAVRAPDPPDADELSRQFRARTAPPRVRRRHARRCATRARAGPACRSPSRRRRARRTGGRRSHPRAPLSRRALLQARRRARAPDTREARPLAQLPKPAALMSRDTGAVGCAPLSIQSLIFASSRSIVDGSV